jgi:hypothetical protein
MLRSLYWNALAAINRLVRVGRAITTEARLRIGKNDDSRWAKMSNLDPRWDERTLLLAEWIPAGACVLEFGAGRQTLKDHLPPTCEYTASDIIARNSQTLVYDLNQRPLAPIPAKDVAVFSGVFEYVWDLEAVAAHLSKSFPMVIASYAATDVKENAAVVWRRSRGWVSDFSAEEFQAIFRNHGYQVTANRQWFTQFLYRFERRDPSANFDS